MEKIRVIQYGVGPIGSSIVRLMLQKGFFEFVGAIDNDESKVGRDLGEIAQATRILNVSISKNSKEVLSKSDADIVVHSTASSLTTILPQLEEIITAGLDVISTSEELVYPFSRQPEAAERLHRLARDHGVTVLGAGVNPGFVMDTLAIMMTGVCQQVDRVHLARIVDAGRRRLPLQKKVGAGLTREEFEDGVKRGIIRHVGLPESAGMIAAALGWRLTQISESIEPIIAHQPLRTEFLSMEAGQVSGVKQLCSALEGNNERIRLDLQMYVGAADQHDSIRIYGIPEVDLEIRNGIQGDLASAAIVTNLVPKVLAAKPGLLTIKDMPVPSAIRNQTE